MNHDDLDRNLVYDRYLMDKLEPDERAQFEAHYIDCERCLDELAISERLVEAWRHASSDISLPVARRASASRMLLPLAATVAAVAVGVAAWSLATQRSLQGELVAARTAAATPAGNVPLLLLSAVRNATPRSAPAQRLRPDPAVPHFLLALEAPGHGAGSFDALIADAAGEPRLAVTGLTANQMGWAVISVPSDRLEPGVYSITLRGSGGDTEPAAGFKFEILPPVRTESPS